MKKPKKRVGAAVKRVIDQLSRSESPDFARLTTKQLQELELSIIKNEIYCPIVEQTRLKQIIKDKTPRAKPKSPFKKPKKPKVNVKSVASFITSDKEVKEILKERDERLFKQIDQQA